MPEPFPRPTPSRKVLESWKEIAAYLGRSIRTAQMWEKEENLPIHRHQHDKQGSVFAYRDEIDTWREARSTPGAPVPPHLVFPEPPPAEATSASGSGRRPVRGFAGALVAVVVLATAGVLLLSKRDSTMEAAAIHSLAVLPFTNTDPGTEHVSDGLTELLIDELAAIPDLRVTARSSVFQYKGRFITPQRAGTELDVGAVVMGEVRREGNRYGVRAELIDVRDGAQIWARRYEVDRAELPALQGWIFADLSARLREGAVVRVSSRHTTSAEAHEQYLLGLQAWRQRIGGTRRRPEALHKAVAHFERAIELDPRFAAAYAGLANTYGVMVGWALIPSSDGTFRVLSAAQKALELDPRNAEAYTSIATTSFKSLWDFEGADRNFQRAIALNPSYATAHQWYGDYLQAMGRLDEARRELELAYRLDPLSIPITVNLCNAFYYERRYREALQFARDVEARDPERTPFFCAGASLLALGDYEAFIEYRETHGEKPLATEVVEAYRRYGARAFYAAQLRSAPPPRATPMSDTSIARANAALGDPDEVFAHLEKAFERRASDVLAFHLAPELDSVRHDPRFRDLARRMGLPQSALEASDAIAAKAPFPVPR